MKPLTPYEREDAERLQQTKVPKPKLPKYLIYIASFIAMPIIILIGLIILIYDGLTNKINKYEN